ncbi:MAG: IPT/TIG domain-containing protein [Treponema sp.]|nr:IPT/TIG domain-containing protein [Treponema sp.]
METAKKFSYLFRKHTFIRLGCLLSLIGIILLIMFFIGYKIQPEPVIESIVPPVGAPGDIVVINGRNFGESRDMSYVEIAGSKLTSSSYVSWSDTKIKIIVPANVQDGLVIVGTKNVQSKPALFANEVDIPVYVPQTMQTTMPYISSLSDESLQVGSVLTINGSNFGESRNQSKVYFTIDYNNQIRNSEYINTALYTENMIEVNEVENGYEYWSDSEIRVRVPDGAISGVVLVDNGKEKSEPFPFKVNDFVGIKSYTAKKIYLIQYSADVKDVVTEGSATISLRCPIPVSAPWQSNVELTEINPEPNLKYYQNCMVQQLTRSISNPEKTVFNQTYVLSVYEINTKINPDRVGSVKSLNSTFYKMTTAADDIIPADDERLVSLYKSIVGNEKGTYRRAKLIYDYMCKNFEILSKNRKDDADPFDLITRKKGDAYDFAVIYTALLRTCGIPALIDCGVLINENMKTQNHWWSEFYCPGFGWVPVDIALGAGLDYKNWSDVSDPKTYYFGNLDSHHIAFSRGLNQLKPFSPDNKIVQYRKSFALQSIWEEASSEASKYSSYWSIPVVKGVY